MIAKTGNIELEVTASSGGPLSQLGKSPVARIFDSPPSPSREYRPSYQGPSGAAEGDGRKVKVRRTFADLTVTPRCQLPGVGGSHWREESSGNDRQATEQQKTGKCDQR